MELMVNPFDGDAFSLSSMTGAINRLPNKYGRLGELNLFPVKSVVTRSILIDEKNGTLNLIQSRPVGSPGQQNTHGSRRAVPFSIIHLPLDDAILPESYAGVRAFGSGNQLETLATIMNDTLQSLKDKHDITLEYLRMGALKGSILDADGTEIYNLYKQFLMKQKVVNFALSAAGTDVRAKCVEVKRHIEQNLKGEIMSSVRVFCDKDFMDALTNHANVKAAYANWTAAESLRSDVRTNFPFGGLMFEEYEGTATDINGTVRKFVEANCAYAFPMGTANTFATFVAPADFLETVGTLGQLYYAKQEPRKYNRGIDVHTQSNPLPLCMRPEVVVKIEKG